MRDATLDDPIVQDAIRALTGPAGIVIVAHRDKPRHCGCCFRCSLAGTIAIPKETGGVTSLISEVLTQLICLIVEVEPTTKEGAAATIAGLIACALDDALEAETQLRIVEDGPKE